MKPIQIMPLLVLAVTLLPGCQNKSIKNMLPETWTMATPGETAREAFNVYDADLRRRSVNRLSAAPFGGEAPYVRVYRLLIDDPDPTVRAACAKALGLHGEPVDVERMIPRLEDEDTLVRWEIAKSLQKLHSKSAIKPLIETMKKDPDPDVRMSATVALGQYAELNVFNSLIGALDDQHFSVVLAAKRSLQIITGQSFGTDGAEWLTWAKGQGTNLFAAQKTYTWTPYEKPYGTLDKMKFWKKKPDPVQPQLPAGVGGTTDRFQTIDDGST